MKRYIVALAQANSRRSGTALVVTPLGDSIEDPKQGDAVVFVAYTSEWGSKLRLEDLEALRGLKLGLWLLDVGRKPDLPEQLNSLQDPNFDAISSATATRPAEKAGKPFLKQFY